MKCETCRRNLGKELLNCPRRNIGENSTCPYQVEQTRVASAGWGCLVAFGFGVGLIPVIAYLIGQGLPLWIKGVLTPLLLVGAFSVFAGIYQLFGRQTIIFNISNGQTWLEYSLFGITILQSTTSAIEDIPWVGSPARGLRYPASVAELYRDGSASEMFSTALLQLMAQGVVTLGEVKISHRFRRNERRYILHPGEMFGAIALNGRLEQRIAEVVGLSRSPEAMIFFEGWLHPRAHRAVLTLEDVLVMVFGGGQPNPTEYLVTEVVGNDAEELDLGEVRGIRQKKLTAGPNTRGKIALDIQSIDQLHRDFWTTAPDHAQEILAQIDLLIHSPVVSRHQQRDATG